MHDDRIGAAVQVDLNPVGRAVIIGRLVQPGHGGEQRETRLVDVDRGCALFEADTPGHTRRHRDIDGGRARFDREQGLPGIVRAKGLLWLAERPDETAFLSLTASTQRIDWLSWWWAALIENGKARLEERPETIRRLWIEPHGDRRQELVFIGAGYDEPVLRAALEACLAAPAPASFRSGDRATSPST